MGVWIASKEKGEQIISSHSEMLTKCLENKELLNIELNGMQHEMNKQNAKQKSYHTRPIRGVRQDNIVCSMELALVM